MVMHEGLPIGKTYYTLALKTRVMKAETEFVEIPALFGNEKSLSY